jgi:hypothetical protein
MSNITPDDPRIPKTNRRSFIYTVAGLVPITLVTVKVFEFGPLWRTEAAEASTKPDNIRILRDGDSIPQVSDVKIPITHNSPGLNPIVELIDTSWGAAFYYPAIVIGGYARFILKAGNPQDTGRVFKIRGLLISENEKVKFETPYDKPFSGDELFAQMFLHRK